MKFNKQINDSYKQNLIDEMVKKEHRYFKIKKMKERRIASTTMSCY